MKKLMIGTDHQTKVYQSQGWVCLDGQPDIGADIVATVPSLPTAVTDEKWDVVCAIHFIEHLFYDDAKVLIQEIYDVLKPGGKLILEQANIEYVAKVILGIEQPPLGKYPWMNGQPEWCGIWALYPQPHMTHDNDLNQHRYGYTPTTLSDLVRDCGFEHVVVGNAYGHVVERDFKIEAIKQ